MASASGDDVRLHSERPRWFWVAVFWLGIGLFDATQTVFAMRAEGMHHAWTALYITLLLSWAPWAAATPIVLRLARRHAAYHWANVGLWLHHLFACAVIGLTYAAWTALWIT